MTEKKPHVQKYQPKSAQEIREALEKARTGHLDNLPAPKPPAPKRTTTSNNNPSSVFCPKCGPASPKVRLAQSPGQNLTGTCGNCKALVYWSPKARRVGTVQMG